jgi:hypothetical protein
MSAKRPVALHPVHKRRHDERDDSRKDEEQEHIEDMYEDERRPSNIQMIARMMASHTSALTDRVSHSR